jgi:hypothetical protein
LTSSAGYYDIDVTATSFTATLTFGYTESALTSAGITEDNITVAYYDSLDTEGYKWHTVEGTVDTQANTISVSTSHFSLWAVTSSEDPVITGVENDPEIQVPDKFELAQNYPNPFNPVTNIRYTLPKMSHVKIEIFNILGQRVRVLVNEDKAPGTHSIRWNSLDDRGMRVASGVYIYRMITDKFVQVRKMVLIK